MPKFFKKRYAKEAAIAEHRGHTDKPPEHIAPFFSEKLKAEEYRKGLEHQRQKEAPTEVSESIRGVFDLSEGVNHQAWLTDIQKNLGKIHNMVGFDRACFY